MDYSRFQVLRPRPLTCRQFRSFFSAARDARLSIHFHPIDLPTLPALAPSIIKRNTPTDVDQAEKPEPIPRCRVRMCGPWRESMRRQQQPTAGRTYRARPKPRTPTVLLLSLRHVCLVRLVDARRATCSSSPPALTAASLATHHSSQRRVAKRRDACLPAFKEDQQGYG
jgi:hypothetical protein